MTGEATNCNYVSPAEVAKLNAYVATDVTAGALAVKRAFNPCLGNLDPIKDSSVCYEGTLRLPQVPSSYFSSIAPYFHGVSIPAAEKSVGQGIGNGLQNMDASIGGGLQNIFNNSTMSYNGPRQQSLNAIVSKNVGSEAVLATSYGVPSIGYHMYSYSMDFYCIDPMGSTNFGKLTNVSMTHYPEC